MDRIPKCACGCGASTIRKGRTGPAPLYASPTCRVRALRQRRSTAELVSLPDQPQTSKIRVNSGSTDDQISRAILEARAVGFALQRLGTQARPDLAWRCTKLGNSIIQALGESFAEIER